MGLDAEAPMNILSINHRAAARPRSGGICQQQYGLIV
jgi:hypothetical protein